MAFLECRCIILITFYMAYVVSAVIVLITLTSSVLDATILYTQ